MIAGYEAAQTIYVAARLDLSVNTVAVHRANIMNTLGVHKTAELVVYALQHGLVKLP